MNRGRVRYSACIKGGEVRVTSDKLQVTSQAQGSEYLQLRLRKMQLLDFLDADDADFYIQPQ